MQSSRGCSPAIGVILLALLTCSTGCAYLKDRGNDALDFAELGVTVSKRPAFSLYVGFLNILSLGYSRMDGTLYGLARRDAGAVPVRQYAGGVLLWGEEQMGYWADFDPADPNSPEAWRVGPIGLIQGPGPDERDEVLNCPKLLHLGWVGLHLNCHLGELADFLLGWTTIDFMGDDTAGRDAVEESG